MERVYAPQKQKFVSQQLKDSLTQDSKRLSGDILQPVGSLPQLLEPFPLLPEPLEPPDEEPGPACHRHHGHRPLHEAPGHVTASPTPSSALQQPGG